MPPGDYPGGNRVSRLRARALGAGPAAIREAWESCAGTHCPALGRFELQRRSGSDGPSLILIRGMGEWSWLAAAGPARVGGVPGPAGLSRPVYGAAQGPSALPSAIPLTFASRSGSSSGALVPGCSLGSLAFEPRPSSACPARATWREDVCVSGGTSPLVTASKRVSPFRDPCSEGGGASAELIIEFVRWCRFAW